ALDKKSGDVIWKAALPGGDQAHYSSIVISEAGGIRQYVQLLGKGVASVAAKDGKFLWRYDKLSNHTANVPTPNGKGDDVFISAGYGKGGALLKLTAAGGEVKFEEVYFNKELKNKQGGVILVGDHVYGDTDDGGGPFCAELMTGKVIWKKKGGSKG